MKKSIIITSIFEPSKAVKKFGDMQDYNLIVVGDKKSPKEWKYKNVEFLSADNQVELGYNILKKLPWNHYCRKMIGYLMAMDNKSDLIIDTDDDNIPKESWNFPQFEGEFLTTKEEKGFINIYSYFSSEKIWPRGLPLDRINSRDSVLCQDELNISKVKIGVWQGLADGDPDVDAIYRLTNNKLCYFDEMKPVVLSHGTICPFNSQNTAFIKETFPLLYLPSFVTFRFTDILRGLVAQPILWASGYSLGFTNATVVQERNDHNYLNDFESEIPCYLNSEKVINIVTKVVNSSNSVKDNLYNAYKALYNEKIVEKEEIELLECWLKDVK